MPKDRWGYAEWAIASDLLWQRSRGRCEACGKPLEGQHSKGVARHHRQRRAVGGDRLANLVLLHEECHTYAHAHPEESRDLGLIVSVYVEDPGTVPLAHPTHGVVRLDDEGGFAEVVAA